MKTKKLNNSGFTVVELVVSFSITLVVILLLFQIVLNLKDIYTKDGVKTELLIKQGLMTKKIADSLAVKDVKSVSKCSEDKCIKFTFTDNSVKDLKYDPNNKIFQFGEYKTKLVDSSTFGTFIVNKESFAVSEDKKDSALTIILPVSSSIVEGEYGIKIVYLYNSNKTAVGVLK